jgi:hypothetical protein
LFFVCSSCSIVGIIVGFCLSLKQKPTIIPNIEEQQQTKTNYNAKYRTAATNKNQL